MSYRADSSSTWTRVNIVGETGWSYATEMNYAITLPDNDLYNDDSFEVKIGSSGTCPGCDDCWFRMLEIYGTPESLTHIQFLDTINIIS